MFDLEDCIAYITNKGAKELAQCMEKRFEPYDITRVQWIAMYYVSIKKRITQKQLANKMGLKEPTVVRLLDRMEKEDLLTRVKAGDDKRVHCLLLTEKGRKVNEKLVAVAEQFKNDATYEISEEKLSVFKEVLSKMLENTKI